MLRIATAETETEFEQVRELVAEYVAWDAGELRRLGLDAEAASDFYFSSGREVIPGEFAPPEGCLLLATLWGKPVGCVAFHRMTNDECELKRLYVRPEARGKHVGQQLASSIIGAATAAGYKTMRLETVTFMQPAIAMYSRLGFRRCPPYYPALETFREISVFMELDLNRPGFLSF